MAHNYLGRGSIVHIHYTRNHKHESMNGLHMVLRATMAEIMYCRLDKWLNPTMTVSGDQYVGIIHRWDRHHMTVKPLKYKLLTEHMPYQSVHHKP